MRKIFLLFFLFLTSPFAAKADNYDFYVSRNYSGQEIGTLEQPFRTIRQAIEKAEQSRPGLRRIHVGEGEYVEDIVIGDSVRLFGENKEKTILHVSPTSTLNLINDNILAGLTISGGSAALTIQGSALIDNCVIKDAKKKGIDLPEGDSLVKISNSTIINNSGKGLYVQKGRSILLNNNIVTNNKGEGFDIRQNIFGAIIGNDISNNTESGIEILSSASDVIIRNNTIRNNLANGIANQSYPDMPELGKIKIYENTLIKNGKYGIYCGAPSGGGKTKTFFSESIILEKNNSIGNVGKPVSGSCHFERQTAEFISNISSDIETSVTLQIQQRESLHDIETAIDYRLASSESIAREIDNISFLNKAFRGINPAKIKLMQDNNTQIAELTRQMAALSNETADEKLKVSIAELINSAKKEIAIVEISIRKSQKFNSIFWIPIHIFSI